MFQPWPYPSPPRQVHLDGHLHDRRNRPDQVPRERLLQTSLARPFRGHASLRLQGRTIHQGLHGQQVREEEVLPRAVEERLRHPDQRFQQTASEQQQQRQAAGQPRVGRQASEGERELRGEQQKERFRFRGGLLVG